MRVAILAVALASAFSATSFADGFSIKPGKYKTTMTMKMSMMPNPMSNTSEQCITPEEASKTPDDIAKEMAQGGSCDVSNVTNRANKMAFSFQCSGGDMGNMNGRYELAYADDNYTVKGNMKANMQGMPVEMTIEGDSKRIGDC